MAAKLLITLVALIDVYLAYVEAFAWATRGKRFLTGMPPETFEPSVILAKNMGL